MALKTKTQRRQRIHYGIRKKISGTSERPRLSVYRSNKAIYVQLINDIDGKTIAAASSIDKDITKEKSSSKSDVSKAVGLKLADLAKKAGITTALFDRSGYLYHGNIKALAEGAREGGLKI